MDDNEESIRKRLLVFQSDSVPVLQQLEKEVCACVCMSVCVTSPAGQAENCRV